MSLKVRVKKKYSGFGLDVAFETESKKIGILGASGCGKSLTLKSIAGLIRPDEGSISYEGRMLFDSDKGIDVRAGKRQIGYLFQDHALFPNMSVRENIEAALHGYARMKRRSIRTGRTDADMNRTADDILREFGLWDVKDQRPHELSGGQKQRTALARIFACDPTLLLLDEPFSAMDSFLKERLRLELTDVLEMYDKTFILVSHDRDEVYQMCDHLILMDNGRVIAQGDTDELFADPGTVAAARLTGCKNISRIEKLTEHRVRALDWKGTEFVTDGKVSDDITHIGIRAHDLMPGDGGVNVIACGRVSVSRLPFEWYITLENGMWWKAARELYDKYDEGMIPQYVSVDAGKILLLRDGPKK